MAMGWVFFGYPFNPVPNEMKFNFNKRVWDEFEDFFNNPRWVRVVGYCPAPSRYIYKIKILIQFNLKFNQFNFLNGTGMTIVSNKRDGVEIGAIGPEFVLLLSLFDSANFIFLDVRFLDALFGNGSNLCLCLYEVIRMRKEMVAPWHHMINVVDIYIFNEFVLASRRIKNTLTNPHKSFQ